MEAPTHGRKHSWDKRHLIALAVVMVATAFAGVALADQVTPDGDIVTVGDQGTVNLGTVAPGAVLTPNTSFKLECNGNNHADNGQTVNLTFSLAGSTVPSGGSLNATNTSIGPIPASWADDGSQCPGTGSVPGPALTPIGDNGDSTVTITAPMTAGAKTFVVSWAKNVGSPDVTGGNVAVTYNLTVAAPSDTTPPVISYVLTPGSPDGNNDWYKSNVTLVWAVTEPDSPGSLVKTGCVDQSITTDQSATTYSCSATSSGGSAGPVSVTVKRDATAPSAVTTLNAAPNGSNDWYTAAPAWTTNGADGLSGLVNDPCATGTYGGGEGTALTVSGSCTDKAGNTTADDSPPFKYDATGPSAALSVSAGTLGSNGWYTSDVTVATNGTDSVSDPTTCTGNQVQATETSGHEFHGSCTNAAGLTTNADPLTVKLDKTGPSAALSVSAGTLGGGGWYRTDVTVSTTGTDDVSSPVSCDADQHQATSTNGQVFNGACTNHAGLTTNASPLTVKLDKVAPTLTWTGGPANGASYYFGSVPAGPTCTAVDPLYSGPNGCTVTDYDASVGSHTMTAKALDLAGNSSSETRTYTVLAWTLNGFFQPVDMGNVLNVVKNGSTVPLKFRVFAGATELTDTANIKPLKYGLITCDSSTPNDEIETVATGGTVLRYDATAGQFVYNWKTPSTAGKCYSVTMATQDGSTLSAFFRLK